MRVAELQGALLDYWIARADGFVDGSTREAADALDGLGAPRVFKTVNGDLRVAKKDQIRPWQPSADWAQAGPIIERERIEIVPWNEPPHITEDWRARTFSSIADGMHSSREWKGSTALVAAMRAYVASKFGEEVPDEAAETV
ncbi:phage protein NinX family protein [Paraburkholderia sp.]|uniref:phage protein NinX family protein n=1 Tax=Paraburkholderia sp. TaxID=1926495 RepID=UPI00238AA304|nr:phage protein NinX family protein [Paraburkholderia sp.]MDE1182324.1 DUF2591 family protein [Paraburkholderia sp.]